MNSHADTSGQTAAPGINLDDDAEVGRALRAAVRDTLQDHKRAGDYVVSWEGGHLVRIAAHDIVVPEDPINV